MSSTGNYIAAAIVLGPLAWRKLSRWRFERKQRQLSEQQARVKDDNGRLSDLRLDRLSNIIVAGAAAWLIMGHVYALLWPAQRLYRSDLFLEFGLPTNAPIVFVRDHAAALQFDNIRWKAEWGDEGLEVLLRRLSSFEGRKLHLALGIEPFVSCTFCTMADDYKLYAAMRRLGSYTIQLLLFSLLTMRYDSLDILDEVVSSLVAFASGRNNRLGGGEKAAEAQRQNPTLQDIIVRKDRHGFRKPMLYILGIFAFLETSVLSALYDMPIGTGRIDHYHANLRLAWHIVLLTMTIFILVSPQRPMVHPIHEIVRLLEHARQQTIESLGHVQAMHLTQQILWGDSGLREHVGKWHNDRQDAFVARHSAEELNQMSQQLLRADTRANIPTAGMPPINTSALQKVRESSRETATLVWLRSAQKWQQQPLQAHFAAHSPPATSPQSPARGSGQNEGTAEPRPETFAN